MATPPDCEFSTASLATTHRMTTAVPAAYRLPLLLLLGAILGCMIRAFLVQHTIVTGPSMFPTFRDGDSCLVHPLGDDHVCRGEIVIVKDGGCRSIKRVVGLPNECLLFKDGRVFVNGHELREPYLGAAPKTYPVYKTRFVLGHQDYFVMGDNRDESEDSRVYGPLERRAIVGKVALN